MSGRSQGTLSNKTETPPLFECKDRFSSISIRLFDNVVVTEFTGPCGVELVKQYTHALHEFIKGFKGASWGYLSISRNFEAATKEAIVELAYSFAHCQKFGCVADAYVIESLVGQKQIKAMREKFGTHTPFDHVLFANCEQAIAYLRKTVSDMS